MGNNDDKVMDFLNDFLSQKNESRTKEPTLPSKEIIKKSNDFIPSSTDKIISINNRVVNYFEDNKSKYEEIYISDLPLGDFYKEGTKIYIRCCTVEEIQDYSTYDNNNPFEFKNALNDILENCVVLINPDGTYSSHLEIFDGDRLWLIYTIREKTFINGKTLSTTITYEDVNKNTQTHKVKLLRKNIELWRNENIMEYFNTETKSLEIQTVLRDEKFIITPPTIGLKNCFDHYMEYKIKNKSLDKKKDTPFLKIAPFLKNKITYMSYDEIEEYEKWFKEKTTAEEYSFLFDLINNHLKIGIRGLKKNMGNTTLRTYKLYPINTKDIFLLPNAFEVFKKK